jgi:NADH-quinone oxidoreductase subunit E
MQENLKVIFSPYEGREGELIPILQQTQEEFGYLPEEAMREIARFTRVSESRAYAVATFYAQFRFTPIGRNHVMVCRGTSCHVRGAPRILEEVEKQLGIKEGETSPDLEYSLETVACIGCCGLSPCIVVNNKVYAKMTPRKVAELFAKGDGK